MLTDLTKNDIKMDETEKKIMESIVKAHNDYVKLQSTHPSDINDWTNAIHKLQDILTRRVLRRDYPNDFITVKNNS
ncbi:hypothetical protein [Elizabethkingia anophelis]|uniref:hypothetical protein n=1 Tax=Elizabethkingia anophelis TaxID=1117645 RepID=UPI0013164C8B|nr:hypothetical protein [Elizabethkingia anophelis]BBQ07944.1 hypothetical protein JUNP353_2515 [Elizabethkingia anophelis]